MTPYLWRLLCLSLAVLCVVQVSAGVAMRLLVPRLIGWAERLEAARAASLMMSLRWLPAALGVFAAVALCVPIYLQLEPVTANDEEPGLVCVTLAGLALLSHLIPLARATARVLRSEARLRALMRQAEEQAGLYIIRETSPTMALAGLFQARVVVSREVVALLTADQLDAARRHERAHQDSRDNWKRVALEAAPIDCSGSQVRAAWSRFSEWAADDSSTQGEPSRSVSLASALVSVARLGQSGCLPQASMLVPDGHELRARVERLLTPHASRQFPALAVISTAALSAVVVALLVQRPACALLVHQLLELLVD